MRNQWEKLPAKTLAEKLREQRRENMKNCVICLMESSTPLYCKYVTRNFASFFSTAAVAVVVRECCALAFLEVFLPPRGARKLREYILCIPGARRETSPSSSVLASG
jgi:hypothetical protein